MSVLILVRHAHRDKHQGPLADNGISAIGKKQIEKLSMSLKSHLSKDFQFYSSPKIRCQETLTPLSEEYGQELEIHTLLDEQGPTEDGSAYQERILTFIQDWEASKKNWIACSHGDWIPDCLQLLTKTSFAIQKSHWLILKKKDGAYEIDYRG